jgi:kynurenine formamidase
MPIYDVTVPLSNDLPTWPADPEVQIRDWQSLSNGDGANVSALI